MVEGDKLAQGNQNRGFKETGKAGQPMNSRSRGGSPKVSRQTRRYIWPGDFYLRDFSLLQVSLESGGGNLLRAANRMHTELGGREEAGGQTRCSRVLQ